MSYSPEKSSPFKKKYEKRPVSRTIDSKKLWTDYLDDQKQKRATRKSALDKIYRQKNRAIAVARAEGGNGLIVSPGLRAILRALTSGLRSFQIMAAKRAYADAKKLIPDERQDFTSWLAAQAKSGKRDALEFLEARREKQEGQFFTGEVRKSLVLTNPAGVTKKGTVINPDQIRETSTSVIMSMASREAMAEGLRLAVQKFNGPITVNGSSTFKANAITAAIREGLDMSFADPAMERVLQKELWKYRRERAASKYISERNLLAEKYFDILKHEPYKAADSGEKIFDGDAQCRHLGHQG